MIVSKNIAKKVYVGMSGGVDSSVAAHLLKEQGYDVVGVYLLCFSGEEEVCRAEQDMEDARAVALKLGIPFYAWNLEKEYKEKVIDYMVEGYRSGITPNPDVMCNREIKFGIFLKRALSLGADFVATGHYVKLVNERGYKLLSARDQNKDQSYFLWTLTQDQLFHSLFPIGDYLKSEVRDIARKIGLSTADKKDSQGVCFVGKIKMPEFLSGSISSRRGEILTASGEKIGEHNGAEFYTIGQRHLGISNMQYGLLDKGKDTKPYYVSSKDVVNNTVTVVAGGDAPELFRREVKITGFNFINGSILDELRKKEFVSIMARLRYRQNLFPAKLLYDFLPQSQLKIIFEEPQRFVASGQSAVFYRSSSSADSGLRSNDFEMLGGGVIV